MRSHDPFEWFRDEQFSLTQVHTILQNKPCTEVQAEEWAEEYRQWLQLHPKAKHLPPHLHNALASVRSLYLRRLVDAWIGTGVDEHGVEMPAARAIFKDPRLLNTVEGYLLNHPPSVRFGLRVGDGLDEDFESVVVGLKPSLLRLGMPVDPAEHIEAPAFEAFVGMLLHQRESRKTVSRCRYKPCGRYFLMKKTMKSYRHGTFCCRQHAARASATAATTTTRGKNTSALLGLAARELLKRPARYTGWAEAVGKRQLLAAAVNSILSKRGNQALDFIQANWIKRHRGEIESLRASLAGE